MKIIIETVPFSKMRYTSCGDWYRDNEGVLHIKIAETDNDDYNFLIGLHEIIEAKLCENRGIKEEAVNEFDINFELNRKEGNFDEPGDSIQSPYNSEHLFATGIEKLMCSVLNIKWKDYEQKINELA